MQNLQSVQDLNVLIGLSGVKTQINELINLINLNKERGRRGLKEVTISHHMAFVGSPGTGKTTVARIVGEIFKELGILSSGHLIEADREKLIGQHIGHTEAKTTALINQAMGGVLFIDEAYALFQKESPNDFGKEAISTLIKRMEDDRHNLVVILAGYKDETIEMIHSNPGMKSRIANYIEFSDYTPDELLKIFEKGLTDNNFLISEDGLLLAYKNLNEIHSNKEAGFGNGRVVRNLIEQLIKVQATRLAKENLHLLANDALRLIHENDIEVSFYIYRSQQIDLPTEHTKEKQPRIVTIPLKLQEASKSCAEIIEHSTAVARNSKPGPTKKRIYMFLLPLLAILILGVIIYASFSNPIITSEESAITIPYDAVKKELILGAYAGVIYSANSQSNATLNISKHSEEDNLFLGYINVYSGVLASTIGRREVKISFTSANTIESDFSVAFARNKKGQFVLISSSTKYKFEFVKI